MVHKEKRIDVNGEFLVGIYGRSTTRSRGESLNHHSSSVSSSVLSSCFVIITFDPKDVRWSLQKNSVINCLSRLLLLVQEMEEFINESPVLCYFILVLIASGCGYDADKRHDENALYISG